MSTPTPVTPAAVADLCERAADELLTRGHAKGVIMDVSGGVCEVGALAAAAGFSLVPYTGQVNQQPRPTKLDDVLFASPLVTRAWSLLADREKGMFWNDRPERTVGEVRDELLHIAKEIHNGELEVCP